MRIIYNFIFVFWITTLPSAVFAQAETPHSIIENSFEKAMTWVAENELEAPAASRIYALTSIILHDSYFLSEGKNGYILNSTEIEKFQEDLLIEDSVGAFFKCLYSRHGKSPCDPQSTSPTAAGFIMKRIFEHLPYLEQTLDEKSIPIKHSVHPEWRRAKPLELGIASLYRPDGPRAQNTDEYEAALSEVKRLGEDVSEFRLADDSLSAAFWGNPAGTMTPPGHWNNIAISTINKLPVEEQLEILLVLNIALYDAGIAAWDAKYHFLYPRPHETIRQIDKENPNWTSMGDVPLHPEYVSGHSAFSGAASHILTSYLGEYEFCNTSKAMWGLERCFASFKDAAEEAGQSRIYGGLHYQFSNQDGLQLGINVAQHALKRLREKGNLQNSNVSIEP